MQPTALQKKLGKMLILSKFQIRSMWIQYIVTSGSLLVQFAICMIVGSITGKQSGSLDFSMLGMSAVFGVLIFMSSYRYSIVSGLTRKMYCLTALLSGVLLSLCYSLFTFALMCITHATFPSTDLYFMVFHPAATPISYGAMFLFLFGGCLFASSLSHFLCAVFYRTRMRGKLILLGAVLLVSTLLIGINLLIGGAIGEGLLTVLKALFGYGGTTPNPFIPFATLSGLSALCAAGSFLLLRRADLRN